VTPYRLAADTFGAAEIAAAKAVLDSGRLTMGDRVAQFEREFAVYTGAKHALMVNSGSSANLLMVDVLQRRPCVTPALQPGDEVIVPALAWPTTVWPIVQLGLVPVFVDVDPHTLAIDLKSVESAISPLTKGMFLIHVLGQAPNMKAYQDFCWLNNLVLIEDACESLGAHSGGQHVGNFGTMGSFSFYYSHHISTIEGGMIVTSDSALYDNLKSLRAHGWIRDRSDRDQWKRANRDIDERFMFIMPGYNVRPMELQGAIGSVQLRRFEEMLMAREQLASTVDVWVKRYVPWLELIGAECLNTGARKRQHSWMTLPFRLRRDAPVSLAKIKAHFQTAGVDTRPIIAGNLVRHPAISQIKSRSAASLKVSDELLRRGFMIGCHPVLDPGSLETLERTLARLAKF